MVTLAQEIAIADILGNDEPLLDTVSSFIDKYLADSVQQQQTVVARKIKYPFLEDIIRTFTADQARKELVGVYKGMRGKGYEKS